MKERKEKWSGSLNCRFYSFLFRSLVKEGAWEKKGKEEKGKPPPHRVLSVLF